MRAFLTKVLPVYFASGFVCLVIISFLTTGCHKPSTIPISGDLFPVVNKSKHIKQFVRMKLYADRPGMQDTGIGINGHAYITLFAKGEVNLWPSGPKKHNHFKPDWWRLMMRLGEKGYKKHPIPEYNNSNTFLVGGKGNLYFGITDGRPDKYGNPVKPEHYSDNTGSFELEIIVWNQFPDENAIQFLEVLDDLNSGLFARKEEILRLKEGNFLVNIQDLVIPEALKIKQFERIYLSKMDVQAEHDINVSPHDIIAVIFQGKIIGNRRSGPIDKTIRIIPKLQIGKSSLGHSPSFDDILTLRSTETSKLYSFLYGGDLRGSWEHFYSLGCYALDVFVWDKANEHLIQSDLVKLIKANPKNNKAPLLLSYMGDYFRKIGDTNKAFSFEKVFSEIKMDNRGDISLATILNHKGKLQKHIGNFDEAIKHFQMSVQESEKDKNDPLKASSLINLGIIYYKKESFQQALDYFQQAWDLTSEEASQGGGGYELGVWRKEDPEIKTLFFKEKAGFGGLKHIAEFWMGNIYKMMKDYKKAYYMLTGLSSFIHQSPMQEAEATYFLSLADVYRLKKEYDIAIEYFDKSLQSARTRASTQIIWRSLAGLATVYEEKGDLVEALKNYTNAIAVIERMRGMLESEEQKATFVNDKMYVYERIIGLLHRMIKDDEAFYYLESSKARAFLDLLGNKKLSGKRGQEQLLLDKERRLKEEISVLAKTSQLKKTLPSDEVDKLKNLRVQYRSVLTDLQKMQPELASMVSVSSFKSKDIQGLLDKTTAMVEYYVGEEKCYVFIITRDKVVCKRLALDPAKLNNIYMLRDEMVENISLEKLKNDSYKRHLRDLYKWLLKPVEEHFQDKSHLVIVPHGILHYLPFHAILRKRDQKEFFLIEQYAISYSPSASVLKFAFEKNKNNKKDLFTAANPKTSLQELPAAEIEAIKVASMFPDSMVLTGIAASEAQVKANSPDFDYLLFSTHGEMIESDPLQSNLRFTDGAGEDGKLTVDEIFDFDIKANLVALSACETGLARGRTKRFPKGDDLVGLTRAFIYAGTPSVLSSLWKVSDESSVELVINFYKNLKQMKKAHALRQAQLDLMKTNVSFNIQRNRGGITNAKDYNPGIKLSCSHPFFWAPFVMIGDWR